MFSMTNKENGIFDNWYDFVIPDPLIHFKKLMNLDKGDNFILERYIFQDGNLDDLGEKEKEMEFKKYCVRNDFKIPKSLKVEDYKSFNDSLYSILKSSLVNKDKFVNENEGQIRNDIFKIACMQSSETRSSSELSFSSYFDLTNEYINQKYTNDIEMDEKLFLSNEIFDRDETLDNDFFCYWKPKDCTKYHILKMFWFFVRVNVLLYLIKYNYKNVEIMKYLKQIYLDIIPSIIKIESFYYDIKKIEDIVNEYKRNFQLKFEFSFKYLKSMRREPQKFEIILKPPSYLSKDHSFTKIFRKFNELKFKDRELKKIMINFGFNPPNVKHVLANKAQYRVVITLFYLMNHYSKKLPMIKVVYSIIPMYFYLRNVGLVNDKIFDNSINENLFFYPKRRLSKKKLFNLSKCTDLLFKSLRITKKELNSFTENSELNYALIKTFFHVLPSYYNIRGFELSTKNFYIENESFAKILDNMIISTTIGFYKWCNTPSLFKENFTYCVNQSYSFFKNFIYRSRVKKLEYIKNLGIELKYVIQEFVVYIIKNNEQFFRDNIDWNVKKDKNSPKRTLTLDNFIYCVIKNCNIFRNKHFESNKKGCNNFIDTRRKRNQKLLKNIILCDIETLRNITFSMTTIFNRSFPKEFEFFTKISKSDMDKLIYFWDLFSIKNCVDSKMGNENENENENNDKNQKPIRFLKINFPNLKDKDLSLFCNIFKQKDKDVNLKFVSKLTPYGRTLIYYLFQIYDDRCNLIKQYPLTLEETIYQTLLQKYEDNKFLKFAYCFCCKKKNIKNIITNLGYSGINIVQNRDTDKLSYFCEKHYDKYNQMNNKIKYDYFRKESVIYIEKFVDYFFNFDNKIYNHYKTLLYSLYYKEKDFMIDDEEEEGEEEGEGEEEKDGEGSFFDLLSEKQQEYIKIIKDKTGDGKQILWKETNSPKKAMDIFLNNLKIFNEISRIFKKMCKWISNYDWDKWKESKNEIIFLNPIGRIFMERKVKSTNTELKFYKYCYDCKKISLLNTKINDFYKYCCDDCEAKREKEEYKSVILVDTENPYQLFTKTFM